VEAWDVIVIGGGAAAMSAAISASRGGSSTLMISPQALGSGDYSALDGIAASLREATPKNHRDDTIKTGDFLSDQDITSERCAQAVRQVDLLERWGMVFRRDQDGLPRVVSGEGHSKARVVDSGDATRRNLQQILEEQCIKHGVVRRGEQAPLSLISSDQRINGIVVHDLDAGAISAIQSKAVIIADDGFQGAWNRSHVGIGMDMVLRNGISLKDMEFVTFSPLYVTGTNIRLPTGILADGATLHQSDGTQLEESENQNLAKIVGELGGAVLDARGLDESADWWMQTAMILSERANINIRTQVIPVEARPDHTIGGIPVDEHGRVIISKWSRWFTGLYAAGDASCSGFHGASSVVGNRTLDSLTGGAAAGNHAAEWSSNNNFTGSENLSNSLEIIRAQVQDRLGVKGDVANRIGPVVDRLSNLLNESLGLSRNSSGLIKLAEELESLLDEAENIDVDDTSLLMNTNLQDTLNLQAAIRLSLVATRSAIERKESRGDHVRADYTERDDENHLHHQLVDIDGNIGELAIRKGRGSTWVLSPGV